MERRKKIAVELSELVVYCRPVPFNEDSKDQTRVSLFFFLTVPVCNLLIRCFQRSARRERVTATCPPSRRRRQRSLRLAAEGNASCSTTGVSFPEFTPEDRGWTRPTTTRCPCGSVDLSWSRSISRRRVSTLSDHVPTFETSSSLCKSHFKFNLFMSL